MTLTHPNNSFVVVILAILLGSLVVGCSGLSSVDPAATLRANREAIELEATSIAQAAQAQATEVRSAVSEAETAVAQGNQVNNQLLLTLRAVFPPTQQIVQNSGGATPGLIATPAPPGSSVQVTQSAPNIDVTSNTVFRDLGTALAVSDADGCSMGLVTSFASDVQRIYATTRALNIRGGTLMRVQWSYQGTLSYEESFTVAEDDDDFCLWFYIEPTNVAFDTGNWSVQLFADESPISDPVAFTIGM